MHHISTQPPRRDKELAEQLRVEPFPLLHAIVRQIHDHHVNILPHCLQVLLKAARCGLGGAHEVIRHHSGSRRICTANQMNPPYPSGVYTCGIATMARSQLSYSARAISCCARSVSSEIASANRQSARGGGSTSRGSQCAEGIRSKNRPPLGIHQSGSPPGVQGVNRAPSSRATGQKPRGTSNVCPSQNVNGFHSP
jgi:hypothetical protein